MILHYTISTEGNPQIDKDLFEIPEVYSFFHCAHVFEYTDKTSLRDFINHFINTEAIKSYAFVQRINNAIENGWYVNTLQFIFRGEMRSIIWSSEIRLQSFLEYIDLKGENLNLVWILGSYGKGDVFRNEGEQIGVRFYFHSNEGNHIYEPHVHVSEFGTINELFVGLRSGMASVLKSRGRFDKKKKKKALEFINSHLSEFLVGWNDMTNGIDVDPIMI